MISVQWRSSWKSGEHKRTCKWTCFLDCVCIREMIFWRCNRWRSDLGLTWYSWNHRRDPLNECNCVFMIVSFQSLISYRAHCSSQPHVTLSFSSFCTLKFWREWEVNRRTHTGRDGSYYPHAWPFSRWLATVTCIAQTDSNAAQSTYNRFRWLFVWLVYGFGLISDEIKDRLNLSQGQLDIVALMGNIGGYTTIIPGVFNNHFGPFISIWIGVYVHSLSHQSNIDIGTHSIALGV